MQQLALYYLEFDSETTETEKERMEKAWELKLKIWLWNIKKGLKV